MQITRISALPRGTLKVSEKENSLFPLGPVIKYLIIIIIKTITIYTLNVS